MENEPPEHTRLRSLVVLRLQPRPRRAAPPAGPVAGRRAARRGRPGGLRRRRGVRRTAAGAGDRRAARRAGRARAAAARPGRRPSCGCTRFSPPRRWSTPPSGPPRTFAGDRARAGPGARRSAPATTWSPTWLASGRPARASAQRGRGGRLGRAAAQRRPRGLGQRLRQRAGRRCCAAGARPDEPQVRRVRRGDAALRLGAPALRAHRHRRRCEVAGVRRRGRAEGRRAARRRQPRPGRLRRRRHLPTRTGTPTRTWPSGPACTSAWARRWRGWSSSSRSATCSAPVPDLAAGGCTASRGVPSCSAATTECRSPAPDVLSTARNHPRQRLVIEKRNPWQRPARPTTPSR